MKLQALMLTGVIVATTGCSHFDRQVAVALVRQSPRVVKVHVHFDQHLLNRRSVVGAEHNYISHQPPPVQQPVTRYNFQAAEQQYRAMVITPQLAIPIH